MGTIGVVFHEFIDAQRKNMECGPTHVVLPREEEITRASKLVRMLFPNVPGHLNYRGLASFRSDGFINPISKIFAATLATRLASWAT